MNVRRVRMDELERLRHIERAAGDMFRDLEMFEIADDEPASIELLAPFPAKGRAWGCANEDDQLVAYVLVDEIDGCGHILQVSVIPEYGRRGLGRALLQTAAGWARARHCPALTLTTFTEVPWNGPYYLRCGFRYLSPEETTPGLRTIRSRERAAGLDRWPRACMRRDLSGPPG